MTLNLDTEAKRLLHAIRSIDAICKAVNGVPAEAMDALTECWGTLCDELMALPVTRPEDVAPKFELLADLMREGDLYAMEPGLLDRATADLTATRNADSLRDFGRPYRVTSHLLAAA